MKQMIISEITQTNYQGYLWYSDNKTPIIFTGDKTVAINERDDAFIVEGLLWDAATRTSLRIYFHDGKQYIYRKEVTANELKGCEYTSQESYVSHRLQGRRLSFLRYWQLVADEYCVGFDTLTPQSLVFVGFENENQ